MPSAVVWRLLDGFVLVAVFIVQSVILSLYTVYSKADAELPNHYVNPVFQKVLWLTGDVVCLLGLMVACVVGVCRLANAQLSKSELELEQEPEVGNGNGHGHKKTNGDADKEAGEIEVSEGKNALSKYSFLGYLTSDRLPLAYISWFFYATLLTVKIAVICAGWIGRLEKGSDSGDGESTEKLEPEMLLLGIGLAGLIFSLLVEAHHNARMGDLKRNAYLNHISYGVALEILDTASLLSFLIPSSDHIFRPTSYSAALRAIIITISALNLVLPCITLYKLTASKFADTYHAKLELIYNSLHFLLVSLPFLTVRIYLWAIHGHKDVLFLIKNMYTVVGYFRGAFLDFVQIMKEKALSKKNRKDEGDAANSKGDNSVEMKVLM